MKKLPSWVLHQEDFVIKQDLAIEELQLKLAIAQGDQETKERIETARLTRDAARLRLDQDKTVIDYTTKGAPSGY